MISKENLGNILEKHFHQTLERNLIDLVLYDLGTFNPISHQDYLGNDEMMLKIYQCFIYKELDFTLTVGMVKRNYTRITRALNELELDYENSFSNILCFKKNISGIVFTHKKIKFHYWTKDEKKRPFEINTISYKLINPAKDLGIDLGKFRIFINAETMLNCMREIETAKVDLFDMRTGEVISRPAKIDLEINPFASIIEKPSNSLEDN